MRERHSSETVTLRTLRVVTPNFKPMVTEEEINQAQHMFRKGRGSIQSSCYENQKATHSEYFLPFCHIIKCSVCGHYMIPTSNRGHSGIYCLNYRCCNKALSPFREWFFCLQIMFPLISTQIDFVILYLDSVLFESWLLGGDAAGIAKIFGQFAIPIHDFIAWLTDWVWISMQNISNHSR